MNGEKENRTEFLFREKWRQINPYYRDDYTDDQRKISLIERIDQVLNDVTVNCPEAFWVDKTSLSHMYRGRKGCWSQENGLLPPSIKDAIRYGTINRWNPPNKRYLYLATTFIGNEDECICTCLEELRAQRDEEITIGEFVIRKTNQGGKLLNQDYDRVSIDMIEEQKENYIRGVVKKDVESLLSQFPFGISQLNVKI